VRRWFGHGQGIHVGTDAHLAAGVLFAAALAVDAGHHAGLAQAAVHGQTQGAQVGSHFVGGAVFFVFQFRVGVQVTSEADQLAR
jgi:hypothetical protein